jgi:hypothetical protein
MERNMSESTALATKQQQIAEIDRIAKDCRTQLANIDEQFSASFALAELTAKLDNAITPAMMTTVMSLQGHALGFRTDKDGKPDEYPVEVVRPAFIEATVRGFRPVNNEFNIIAGRFYGCKNGFERIVKTFPDLVNFQESMAVPEMKGGAALVPYVAHWELCGEPMAYQRSVKKLPDGTPFDDRIVVRVNSGMGHDAVLGKAYRKAYAGIYDLLTGHTTPTPEGDVSDSLDVASRPSGVRQSGLFSDEPVTEEVPPDVGIQEDKLKAYEIRLDECESKTDVSPIAKAAGADTSLSDATRKEVAKLCTEKRKEL